MSTTITTSNSVLRARSKQTTLTTTQDIKANDAGVEFNIATDAKIMTLPAITAENIGAEFTFRNTGADGNNTVTISPKDSNKIIGGMTQAAAVFHSSGVLGKDLINTKATSKLGDWVELRAVSLTEYYIVGGQGIWASES